MNRTSTKVPMWQLECQNFWRAGSAYEVRDVTTEEDQQFIEVFAASHNLPDTCGGTTVAVSAPDFSQPTAAPKPNPSGEGTFSRSYA